MNLKLNKIEYLAREEPVSMIGCQYFVTGVSLFLIGGFDPNTKEILKTVWKFHSVD